MDATDSTTRAPIPTPAPPTNAPLKPKDLSDILGEMFDIYAKHFWPFVGLIAVFALISAALYTILLAVGLFSAGFWLNQNTLAAAMSSLGWLFVIATIFLVQNALLGGCLARMAAAHYAGEVRAGPAVHCAWKRLWRILVVQFLVSLAVGALSLTIIGIPVAIHLGNRWAFAQAVIMVENAGATQALARSAELVKDQWWRTFGINLLLGIIVGFMTLASLSFPILGALVAPFIAPFPANANMSLYLDLRARKQAVTIDGLAAEFNTI